KCVDSAKFRPGKVLEYIPGKMIKVTNLLHQNKFWTAEIPLGKHDWSAAYVHIVRFPVVEGIEAAHSQLRFKKDPDAPNIKLTLQTDPSKTTTIPDLILTVEAAFPKDVAYSFADGAFDNYPLVGRLESGIQRIVEDSKVETEQYTLKLDKTDDAKNREMIATLVAGAVKKSESIGLTKFYNTIRPNCVTEIFDLIDETRGIRWCDEKSPTDLIAGQKGQCVRPFYTAMWIDPVAKPALRALEARGILGERIMNLKQEYSPFIGKPAPPAKDPVPSLVRSNPKKPFALVTISVDTPSSRATSKLVEKELEKTLSAAIPSLTSIGIAPALAATSSSGAIGGIVKYVQGQLSAMVKRVNDKLPDTPVYMVAYLAPWSPNARPLSLAGTGFPADLPFNYDPRLASSQDEVKSLINTAYQNMRELQNLEYRKFPVYSLEKIAAAHKSGQKLANPNPVFLLGTVIRLKLQRDRSESIVQAVLSMVPQDLPFSTAATVDLNRVRIPLPARENSMKSTMIVTHFQKLIYNQPNPIIDVEFGGLAPIVSNPFGADRDKEKWGLAKIYHGPYLPYTCDGAKNLVPEMQGTFYPNLLNAKNMKGEPLPAQVLKNAALGVESALQKQPVGLGIFGLKLVMAQEYCEQNIQGRSENQKIKFCRAYGKNTTGVMVWDMEVSFRTAGICLVVPQVGEIVTGEANSSIEYQVGDLKKKVEKGLMNIVMGSNNDNAKLAAKLMMEANTRKAQLDALTEKARAAQAK
ncbi:MAG TPA: hypothetical protein VM432_03315, partial [Bdellovibrionales bacterium]|nr:hypothetical protein [Bdellovibrionales bacterium]